MTQSQKNTVPIPSPQSMSRYTRHNRYTWNALLLVRPEYAPVPPPKREVLETGPGHSSTQPPAHTAGCHCGVLRREVRPTVGVEGADVVGAIHVSGWMYMSLVLFRLLVCVCAYERGRARAIEREGDRERYVPEPDVGLDVRDGKPRSGLAYPAEKEEVFPVRVLDPDVLECECRPCGALPAGSLDFDSMEQTIPQNSPVTVLTGASRLPIFHQNHQVIKSHHQGAPS